MAAVRANPRKTPQLALLMSAYSAYSSTPHNPDICRKTGRPGPAGTRRSERGENHKPGCRIRGKNAAPARQNGAPGDRAHAAGPGRFPDAMPPRQTGRSLQDGAAGTPHALRRQGGKPSLAEEFRPRLALPTKSRLPDIGESSHSQGLLWSRATTYLTARSRFEPEISRVRAAAPGLRACQEITFTLWREHRRTCGAPGAGRCQAPRRRRCGDIVEERQRRRCPPAAAPLRAAARRPAGRVAHSLHTTTGMLVARALPAGLGACSKVQTLFLDRPLGGKNTRRLQLCIAARQVAITCKGGRRARHPRHLTRWNRVEAPKRQAFFSRSRWRMRRRTAIGVHRC